MTAQGARVWIFADGYLPEKGEGEKYVGHDCLCVVNTGLEDADLRLDFYFEDREAVENVPARIGAKRSLHLRLDQPVGNFELPREVPYSLRLRSSVPVVAQYSRLDVTQPNATLMTSLGYALEMGALETGAPEMGALEEE